MLPRTKEREFGTEGMISRLAVTLRPLIVVFVLSAHALAAQVVLPPGFNRAGQQVTPQDKQQQQKQEPQQTPGQPPANQAKPPAQQTPGQPAPATTTTPPQIAPASPSGGFNTQNASLAEVIDI